MAKFAAINRVLLVWLCLLLSACASVPRLQEPEIGLNRVLPLALGLQQQRFQLVLDVYNPNASTIVIHSMDYHVSVEGRELAGGSHNDSISLPASSQRTVEIAVTSQLLDVLPLLQRQLSKPQEPMNYLFEATVRLSRPYPFTFKLARKGELRVPIE